METDRLDRWIPRLMVLTIMAVAVFAFVQSYSHVFYLGLTHHQTGASLRMLPLSVDWVMFAAGLAMLHLGRKGIRHPLPRATLVLGASATLIANVAFGIVFGWETALISAWAPVALFVVVELGMLLVRTAKAKPEAKPELKFPKFDKPLTEAYLAEFKQKAATELRQPEPAPSSEVETTTIPKVVDSPAESLAGWGQLGGQQAAGQGLTGIGLNNGRK